MRHITKYFGVLGTTLLLSSGTAGHAMAGNAAIANQTPAVEFQGPRQLSDAERQAALPVPSNRLEAKDAVPLPRTDLSGFTVRIKSGKGPTAHGAVSGMVPNLVGPVSGSLNRYSGFVSEGTSVSYILVGAMTVASLYTDSGDADLYMENCDGSTVSSSTHGGTSPDDSDIYTPSGESTCRIVRVSGYLSASFQLSIYNYE